jgi:hypothetical protein
LNVFTGILGHILGFFEKNKRSVGGHRGHTSQAEEKAHSGKKI